MDKITEEVITNLIRRIEILEGNQSRLPRPGADGYYPPVQNKQGFKKGEASKAQRDYLLSLGGDVWDGMTKSEAGQAIDRQLKLKTDREAAEPEGEEFPKKVHEELAEGTYEEPKQKPLTKKEIEEIGEENLL